MNHSANHPYPYPPQAPQHGNAQAGAPVVDAASYGPSPYAAQPVSMAQAQYAQAYSPMGYYGYANMSYPPQQAQSSSLLNDRFLKGLLIGAAAAYLLTNEDLQRTAIKGAVKAWSLLQGGVEEIKERFHDAEAEIRAENAE
jgi:hypothetical protein